MAKKHIEPITSSNAFAAEQENNARKFIEMMKNVRGDLYVLMDVLDQTKISWFPIVKIIRALHMISKAGGGEGWGQVVIEISNDRILFIRGIDTARLDEPITEPEKEP